MKIVKKQEEPLCKRTLVTLEGEATPSNADLKKQIAKDMKCDPALVVMKKIDTGFGSREAIASALVYDSEEAKRTFEKKTKHIREQEKKAAEEAKAAEEKKAEEAKAAKAAEEAKAETAEQEKSAEENPEAEKAAPDGKSAEAKPEQNDAEGGA